MEWIFILIGIAYSIYSSIKKEAKAREAKMRSGQMPHGQMPHRQMPHGQMRNAQMLNRKVTAQTTADELFAGKSGRRTLGGTTRDINTVEAARSYGQDVSAVQELSVEDIQEDFTTRLNRKLMERGAQPALRRSISEVFGDSALSENKQVVDYDELSTYDDRSARYASSEHDARSHFKLNEGLRKDSFKVGGVSAFDELNSEEEASRRSTRKSVLKLDPESLKQYIVMHEVLGKPRAMQPLRGRGRR
jgi:hypothetical protein